MCVSHHRPFYNSWCFDAQHQDLDRSTPLKIILVKAPQFAGYTRPQHKTFAAWFDTNWLLHTVMVDCLLRKKTPPLSAEFEVKLDSTTEITELEVSMTPPQGPVMLSYPSFIGSYPSFIGPQRELVWLSFAAFCWNEEERTETSLLMRKKQPPVLPINWHSETFIVLPEITRVPWASELCEMFAIDNVLSVKTQFEMEMFDCVTFKTMLYCAAGFPMLITTSGGGLTCMPVAVILQLCRDILMILAFPKFKACQTPTYSVEPICKSWTIFSLTRPPNKFLNSQSVIRSCFMVPDEAKTPTTRLEAVSGGQNCD